MSKSFSKYLIIVLVLLGIVLFISEQPTTQPQTSDANITMDFFYVDGCHFCAAQKEFNTELENEFPNLDIIKHDAAIPEEYRLLQIMTQNHTVGKHGIVGVPATFINGKMFVGFSNETAQKIRETIAGCVDCVEEEDEAPEEVLRRFNIPYVGIVDLSGLSLPLLAIVLGIIDGFNPCAIWVLIYLITLLIGLKDKKRVWLIAGTFVIASGVLYFLFMTAWLNAFLFFGYIHAVTIIVGLVGLGIGIISIKEFFEKSAITCNATNGKEKKKIMQYAKEIVLAPLTAATILSIIVLALVVNAIEFLCSAAIPTVFTQLLVIGKLSTLEQYAYILLYVVFFTLDSLLVFGLAAFTITGISGEKYIRLCRLIGGIILLLLGLMLLFAPSMLQ
ncbi:hypothetical protein KKF81_04135 [Candidatus Micrarchaeota archaeon]|nr:hypothetical protein [Candidatus Micrarchaeota archaeon]MBU1166114.1 hypothetical protein [Candidatus Micrarchaeota archaeon]MBU1887037.1 hypothetical protein [Candidatus Micrarchaeota archaeon]